MQRLPSQDSSDLQVTIEPLPAGALRILQITDTHLYEDPDRGLLGINTRASLASVLGMIDKLGWPFDAVLATGDLVHDSSKAGYRYLAGLFNEMGVPVFCLPGNHDKPHHMNRWLVHDRVSCAGEATIADWHIVMLNSVIPNEDGGRLAPGELERLDASLTTHSGLHTLICLHHHPLPVHSTWMDTMTLEDSDAFFEVVDRYPQVAGVLCGHVHQTFDGERNGVRLMATPSTCIQFAPFEHDFKVDGTAPGCRLIGLCADGSIQSEVKRLTSQLDGLDLGSGGY
jgi:Icc protein